MDEADALAIAQGYYDALPYAEGYVFHRVEKFDGESWMYCFDRPIDVTLWGQKTNPVQRLLKRCGSSSIPVPELFRIPTAFMFPCWTTISRGMNP